MKMNPKIAKTVDDLKRIEFRKMKSLIRKDLARLEKNTAADKPTQVIVVGDFAYTDKPAGIGFILFGAWKSGFKTYAKNEIGKDNLLGAIGQAYYGGIDQDGQKVIHIDLAKGKAKGKSDKLAKGLRKLVPQTTYNLIFGEMSEDALNGLEKKLDAAPEPEEIFEEIADSDTGEVEVAANQDYQKLLDSNLKELTASLPALPVIAARIKSNTLADGDADTVTDTLDLANEWLELFVESPEHIKTNLRNTLAWAKVQNIVSQVNPMQAALEQLQKIKNIQTKMQEFAAEINNLTNLFA